MIGLVGRSGEAFPESFECHGQVTNTETRVRNQEEKERIRVVPDSKPRTYVASIKILEFVASET